MRLLYASMLAGVVGFVPVRAYAQSAQAGFSSSAPPVSALPRLPPVKEDPIGILAYVLIDAEKLAATKSFTAVLGTARSRGVGGGIDVVRIWRGAFGRFSAGQSSKTGSRVIVDSDETVYVLSIPLTVTITDVEIGGGWRFSSLDAKGRLVPFVGASKLWRRYEESSMFAEAGENVDSRFLGDTIFGGVELNVSVMNVAVEGLRRRVPQGLGVGGVSSAFKENDLGGGVVRLRIGVGF